MLNKKCSAIVLRILGASLLAAFVGLGFGCPDSNTGSTPPVLPAAAQLQSVNLSDLAAPLPGNQPVSLSAARNEWASFTIQVVLPAPGGYWLRVRTVDSGHGLIPVSAFSAFQILPMPVDAGKAGYVRHTGQAATQRSLPRALLPQPMDGDGTLNLASLRNPSRPADPRSRSGGPGAEPAMLWFDLHIPRSTTAGEYTARLELMAANQPRPIAALPVGITVFDFELPDERHLQMVGRLGWDRLEKLFPSQFETFTPSWLNRREGRYQATMRTLDHLMALSQENRANLVIPALKPIVKWPAGEGPRIDWRDFDSMVRPWFSGDAFSTHVGLDFWPLPEAELLDRYDRASQLQYWSEAATHFEGAGWLGRTAVALEKPLPRKSGPEESAEICAQAAEILKCHPAVRVLVPLEDQQVRVATAENANGIPMADVPRLLTAGATLVSPLARVWGDTTPRHWLRTDLPGLVPYVGAGGDERDVRVWAWLAFLRHIDNFGVRHIFEPNVILWDSTLPLENTPDHPADPGELVWFYPGEWFGVDLPVPTVQLKWMRRAQQDYEYLLLAQQRGEVVNTLQLARLLTKPVSIEPGQSPDPVYSLMTGTSSQQAWDDARRLLAETILLRKPGEPPNLVRQGQLHIKTLQLCAPQERPLLMGRGAQWSWSDLPADRHAQGTWVDLNFALDIYNASEITPEENHLRWARVPPGWQIKPQELEVPRLETYRVLRASLRQKFNLDHVTPASREPMELQFINGFNKVVSPLKIVLPVAVSDKHEGRLSIDGTLDDWSAGDLIQDGPLVKMFNRPAVQRQELQLASTSSAIYTAWARENFYVAFSVDGLAPRADHTRNFVDYQQRRAWGEDLCEILIQPITADNKPGPALHVVCKPNGSVWVERKGGVHNGEGDWKALESAGIRYAAATPDGGWRGEVAIPWTAITDIEGEQPSLLRFNFAQHRAATGESATWAGPVDFGRDDNFMGLIYLRTPGQHGANDLVQH